MKKLLYAILIAGTLFSCAKTEVNYPAHIEAKGLLDTIVYSNGYSWRTLAITAGMYQHNVNFEVTTEDGLNFVTAGDWVGSHWYYNDSVAEIWSDVFLDTSYSVRMLEVFYHFVPEAAKSERPILTSIHVLDPNDTLGLTIEYKVKLLGFSKHHHTY